MAMEVIDLTQSPPSKPASRRKRKVTARANEQPFASSSKAGPKSVASIDLCQDNDQGAKPRKKTKKNDGEEKRLKRFREGPPQNATYQGVYERAVNQRMFCLDRERGGTADCPVETLKIAGSTGNVYTINISQIPSCDCPHAAKGHECKHVMFALVRVLKASSNLYYQRAFLKSELREIFARAPPIVAVDAKQADNNRKAIEDDDTCPICFMEFEQGQSDAVYCKAACGNNIHKECFDQWAASRKRSNAPVTCPFCRSKWDTPSGDGNVSEEALSLAMQTEEGYANVASSLGLSRSRDYSTYHSYWVRGQQRAGVDTGDQDWG